MARIDSLRLLLIAEPQRDVEAVELLLTEITRRLDTLDEGSDAHRAAHARLDQLLELRDRLAAEPQHPGGG